MIDNQGAIYGKLGSVDGKLDVVDVKLDEIVASLFAQRAWFAQLDAKAKKILRNQVFLLHNQNKAFKEILQISSNLDVLKNEVHLNLLVSEYSEHVNNLEHSATQFRRIDRGPMNMLLQTNRLDLFIDSALSTDTGLERSIDMVFKMMTTGSTLNPRNIYMHNKEMCTEKTFTYLMTLAARSIKLYGVATLVGRNHTINQNTH